VRRRATTREVNNDFSCGYLMHCDGWERKREIARKHKEGMILTQLKNESETE